MNIVIKRIKLTGILLALLFLGIKGQAQELAIPSAKQIRFADWELGAFIHFGLNVFTDMEHGDGQYPPTMFNPTELDAEQWVITAKKMGAKYVCLTARHEGGFCLWPSKTTDYTIANSPYKNGKGDIVKEFVNACHKHDIIPALYHTAAFDANATLKDYKGELPTPLKWMTTWGESMGKAHRADPNLREKLKAIQLEQMRELLTNYGPIGFMWSDHWDASKPNGVWRAVTDLAAELQPDLVFMGPDTWVPGNETGHVVYPMWNAVHTKDGTVNSRPAANKGDETTNNNYGLLEGEVRTGHPYGEFWRPRECTTNSAFHYGGWFWHPDNVKKTTPRPLSDHINLYYRTVGLGANTIINLPPDNRGLIPDDFVAAAEALGKEIKKRFGVPIAQIARVEKGNTIELSWENPTEVNTIVAMENIATGQRVVKYNYEAFVNGTWIKLEPKNRVNAWKPYNASPGFETIGHKKIDRVTPVVTNRIRFNCLKSAKGTPELRSLQVFNCEPLRRTFSSSYPFMSGVETTSESGHGGIKRDKDYRGGNIELDGHNYKHGLLTCPVAETKLGYVEFDLKKEAPNAKGFSAIIGIEDMVGMNGSVEFRVKAFSQNKWETIYQSKRIRGEDNASSIEVYFPKGASKLRLETTNGGDNANSDHAIWAEAKFIE